MVKISFLIPSKHKHQKTGGDNLFSRPKYLQSIKPPDSSLIYLRKKPISSDARSGPRSSVRSRLKDLSELYQSLSPLDKETWEIYKNQLLDCNSAWKAFLKINSQLLLPSIPGSSALSSITSPHQNPLQPICFASVLLTETALICVSWKDNYLTTTYIELWRWVPPGVRRETSQPMIYLDYGTSTQEQITFSVYDQDVPRENQLFIRALNLRGEVSPFAPWNPVRKTQMRSGVYGYSSYAYSHYQS